MPLASSNDDFEAKRFATPSDGRGRVYLVRPFGQKEKEKSLVYLDGELVAELGPLTYAALDLPPGKYLLGVQTGDAQQILLDVTPGKIIYVQYQLDQLFNTITSKLKELAADQVQPRILRSKRVATLGSAM